MFKEIIKHLNENENENESENGSVEIPDSFKTDIINFDILDNRIKEIKKHLEPLQKILKELKAEKMLIQKSICSVMSSHGIGLCNLPKDESNKIPGTIKFMKSNTLAPLNSDQIKLLIENFFDYEYEKLGLKNKKQKAQCLIAYIYDRANRPKVIKESLRRVKSISSELIDDLNV